jgi:hypothetical protein
MNWFKDRWETLCYHVESKADDIASRSPRFVWLAYSWLMGYIVCYDAHKNGEAFCKRRTGHFGCHRTASGLEWNKHEKDAKSVSA